MGVIVMRFKDGDDRVIALSLAEKELGGEDEAAYPADEGPVEVPGDEPTAEG